MNTALNKSLLQVQLDITTSLNLRDPLCLVSSFDRPNINFSVWPLRVAEEAAPAIAKLLRGAGEPCAVVYALKRDTADDIALRLRAAGDVLPSALEASVVAFLGNPCTLSPGA